MTPRIAAARALSGFNASRVLLQNRRESVTSAERESLTRCFASKKGQRPLQAFRPIPIKLITVSKGNSPALNALAGEWADKLRRYTTLLEHQVKPNPKRAAHPEVIRAGEAERLLKLLKPQDEVIILDERGRSIDSHGLADMVAEAGANGAASLAFCIGGPYGHSESVRKRGTHVISLSSLVLNHQIAVVVLLEALYRSFTILRGEPYHH